MKLSTWKKGLLAFVALAAVTIGLAGCSSSKNEAKATEKKTVTLWAGGSDNVKVGMQKIVDAYNSDKDSNYTLKLEFIMSGNGTTSLQDRIIAAKKANQKKTDFDLILVSDAEYGGYTQLGGDAIFTSYDKEKIPNLKNLKATTSVGKGKIVPYRGTSVVLAYNSEKVKDVPKTADELTEWIKDNPGRFAYNTPGSGGAGAAFVQSALYNYLPEEALTSSDAKWEKQWDQGFALLKSLNSSMYKSGGKVVYPNKNQGTLDLLANGEVDMIPAWADMVTTSLASGALPKTIKMTQIDPGFTANLDTLAIPSIGSNKAGAEEVINYMLTKKAQNILVDSMAAIPVIDKKEITAKSSKYLQNLNVADFRRSSIGDLGTKMNEEWDQKIGTLTK